MTQLERGASAPAGAEAWARTRVLDGPGVSRALTRLAHEIVEGHPGELERVVLAGIREGGVAVARSLWAHLRDVAPPEARLVAVDVSGFRDDRPRRSGLDGSWQWIDPATGRAGTEPAPSPEEAIVILVDDVIQTGRTMRAAFDVVSSHGRPAAIEMAVLVDRGGREVPVRPNYVGKNLPVAPAQWVEIERGEEPGVGGIFLVPRP
ncbi:MAG: bifunctional pyr operon transcriptional regulator/uracil phosphoribosyltransferase [Candidatus Dormibacteria bacterium]